MTRSRTTARIHLLPAKEAPVAVILRRKPSRTWHILKWNLKTDELTSGSWFRGRLYPMRSDVSWDGQLMSYFALGGRGDTWCGICEVPFLKTVAQWNKLSALNGGAVWLERDTIYRNAFWMDGAVEFGPPKETAGWLKSFISLFASNPKPDELAASDQNKWETKLKFRDLETGSGEDLSMIYYRLHRDGWRPAVGGKPSPDVIDPQGRWIGGEGLGSMGCMDTGWIWQPTAEHPVLRVRYAGWRSDPKKPLHVDSELLEGRTGYVLHFDLPDLPGVLAPQSDWATWASTGDLIYTLSGSVYRHTLQSLKRGEAPIRLDLEWLAHPGVKTKPAPGV